MAKKKAAAKPKTSAAAVSKWKVGDQIPKGYKQHKDHITPARSTTCKVCNEAITPKTTKPKKAAKAAPIAAAKAKPSNNGSTSAVELIKLARQFVSAAGGTGEAAEILLALSGSESHG